EKALESIALDPAINTANKSQVIYDCSVDVVDDVLTEHGVSKNIPRLQRVARSVTSLVMKDDKAFAHLFATAQHDFYTATHMVNVGTWMTALACAMGIT